MPLQETTVPLPCPNQFAEYALLGSIFGRTVSLLRPAERNSAVRRFWTASRKLQSGWQSDLTLIHEDLVDDAVRFERVTLEVLLTEMLTRVWATNWTIADRAEGMHDVERIFSNTLQAMGRVRREILLLMVRNWQGPSAELVSRLDRFRRRSERWTDLLIAGPGAVHHVWDFAVEPQRAQDFSSETWLNEASPANPVSLLVSAGLRVMFGSPWPLGCCRREPFGELLSAIRSTLPAEAIRDDGHLRPAWEWHAG